MTGPSISIFLFEILNFFRKFSRIHRLADWNKHLLINSVYFFEKHMQPSATIARNNIFEFETINKCYDARRQKILLKNNVQYQTLPMIKQDKADAKISSEPQKNNRKS